MKDREWCEKVEAELSDLKKRIDKLEGKSTSACTGECSGREKVIELDIEWPEADIGGLHFNKQKTRGVFELKGDGNYYSKDILIHSARDTDNGTDRDLLSEYLASEEVKEAFHSAARNADMVSVIGESIRVFLPEENQGVKNYNGVSWWYWLKPRYSGSSSDFCIVSLDGHSYDGGASSVGGCAPAFCVGANRHE